MLTFIDVIPARNSIRPGDSLNILGGAANRGKATESDISVWGSIGNGWVPLVTKSFAIEEGEHKHLYFTITPEMLYDRLWDGTPDEFELIIRDSKPGKEENGVLIFLNE